MPELPEVETTLRGLKRYLAGKTVQAVDIRCPQLRWPIPLTLITSLTAQTLNLFSRRGKYLLLHFDHGTLIIHLGMSGRVCILTESQPPNRHDHVDITFAENYILRYTDPRRFGAILWTEDNLQEHFLLKHLGIEPLDELFTGQWLFERTRKSQSAIKLFIMNANIIVGVGNIYAAEALFLSRIHPMQIAKSLTLEQCYALANAIKQVLKQAILRGGTTLKDFKNSEGKPGYFSQQLQVYGRQRLPCVVCNSEIQLIRLANRSTTFCPRCQLLPSA